ncbi:ketopantoate reductase family protein [Celeribacter litoreus]|uniref:ketopantoate reductase family protein n=1 Tax=Celeribacter litoreus TaxID=2876714 RepID=UPI001CCE4031|nr:2-dehydropantoate 2-reductase [Celeribacter litoreus]MCA0043934.1 2-dehydropantoate 2-reductase [Celeribacter litoreus]
MTGTSLKIGVIGAGNIGTAMAALLSRSGAEVFLTARNERLRAVSDDGIRLNDRGDVIEVHPFASEVLPETMDAVFVCVKSQSLPTALLSNAEAIGPETLIIPMVNGMPFWFFATENEMGQIPYLDPKGDLAKLLRPSQILGAVLLMTVRMDESGQAISSNTPTLSIGTVATGAHAEKIERLVATLEAGGVRTDLSDDIRQKVLVKLLANLTTNPLTALTGATLEAVGQTEMLREIATELADEFRSWAKDNGYDLPSNEWLVDLFIEAGDFPTSMLQDALAGRALELDAICRAPLELARRDGGDMPLLARLIADVETAARLPVSDVPAAIERLANMTVYARG